MKPGEFESATMPHVNALFQTALQLSEDRAAAEELVTEVCSYAWKSFGRSHHQADWRSALFKILIERTRRPMTVEVSVDDSGRAVIRRLLVDGQPVP